jgi:hypothetical protein
MTTVFSILQNFGDSIFGDMTTAAVMIMIVMVIALIMIGLSVRFSIMATMPLAIAFGQMGWLDAWVVGIYWIGVVGFSLYTIWTLLQAEYF